MSLSGSAKPTPSSSSSASTNTGSRSASRSPTANPALVAPSPTTSSTTSPSSSSMSDTTTSFSDAGPSDTSSGGTTSSSTDSSTSTDSSSSSSTTSSSTSSSSSSSSRTTDSSTSATTSSDPPTSHTTSTTSSDSSSSTPTKTTSSSSSATADTSSPINASIDPSLTTFVTSFVTTINGERSTIYASITAPIAQDGISGTSSATARNRIIIGGAVGGSAFVAFAVLLGFFYWRWQRRSIANAHRRLGQPRNLQMREDDFDLAAQDMDYTDVGMAHGVPPHPIAAGPQPIMLLRPRGSGTGSIFHEEGIWPPPAAGSRLQDPLLAASEVDLTQIIDDVMGSRDDVTAAGAHRSTSPTSYSPHDSPHGARSSHMRDSTSGSSAPLLGSPRHGRFSSTGSVGRAGSSPLAYAVGDDEQPGPSSSLNSAAARKAREALGDAPPSSYAAYSSRLPWAASADSTVRSRYSLGSDGRAFSPDSAAGPPNRPGSTLRLVNVDPDDDTGSMAPPTGHLVDVSTRVDEADAGHMQEIPPLYHTIRRDTASSASSNYSTDSRR